MKKEILKKDEILYSNGLYNRELLSRLDDKERMSAEDQRKRLFGKKYLSELILEDNVEFGNNNLILAPVGSGKSNLIETLLIPENFNKKIIYLTSNTALKDSLSPNDNKLRKLLAENGQSIKFFTTENRKTYGDKPYSVHVMSYHEFGSRIEAPYQTFTDDVGLIFCDEIHSLPIFSTYGNNGDLSVAKRWLFKEHENIQKFYFTATEQSIKQLEKRSPGYLTKVKTFNYLDHPNIRQYRSNSIYYVNHIEEIRLHLRARLTACNSFGDKGLAFSRKISEQEKIAKIVEEEGYKPLILWSINNEEVMSEEQLRARSIILSTGLIPEPYNILIVNGAMQEGWNLHDERVSFAIINTTDETERVQALGRIRKDVDFVVYKTDDEKLVAKNILIDEQFLNRPLDSAEKVELCESVNILDRQGRLMQWRGIRNLLEYTNYTTEDRTINVDGKRQRTTTITIA